MAGINPRQPLSPAVAIRQLLTSTIKTRQSLTPPSIGVTYNEHFSYQLNIAYDFGSIVPGVAIPRATTPANVTPRVLASASMKRR